MEFFLFYSLIFIEIWFSSVSQPPLKTLDFHWKSLYFLFFSPIEELSLSGLIESIEALMDSILNVPVSWVDYFLESLEMISIKFSLLEPSLPHFP